MSIEEQIAQLQNEQSTNFQQYERRITDLLQQASHPDRDLILPSGRRLIRSTGRSLSQVILEERGLD